MTFLHAMSLIFAFFFSAALCFAVACYITAIYAKRKGDLKAHDFLKLAGNDCSLVLLGIAVLYHLVYTLHVFCGVFE